MHDNPPHLENWYFGAWPNLEMALPTDQDIRLLGIISNDVVRGYFPDGVQIHTSKVLRQNIDLDNNRVLTDHGAVYTLGYVDPEFLKYLEENNHALSEFWRELNEG